MWDYNTIYFKIASALALAIFALGLLSHLSLWLRGNVEGKRFSSVWTKAGHLLYRAPAVFFRGRVLKAFFWDGLLQRQLLKESSLRWVMHMSLTWGSLELLFVGSLGNMAREYGLVSLSKDAPWFAVVNEIGGLLLLLGVGIASYRRYILRVPQLRTEAEDSLILGWLAVAALSGYLVEAGRLLSQGVSPHIAVYSFIGYGLSRLLQPLGFPWASAYPYLWWTHAIVALSLVAYIPYSKLFHILTSPVSIMLKSSAPDCTISGEQAIYDH